MVQCCYSHNFQGNCAINSAILNIPSYLYCPSIAVSSSWIIEMEPRSEPPQQRKGGAIGASYTYEPRNSRFKFAQELMKLAGEELDYI